MGKDSKGEKGREKEKSRESLALPTLEPCGICLEKIVVQGALPCCKHSFCFVCIHQWAKVTNRCPLCKQPFKFINELLPEGKEEKVKVKEKEQDHQYTLEELDEAIGDDESEDNGPEWYFIDREADEASDDEDEEESIERQRKEGYHFYDNLQRENEKMSEESRDSRSIELSDQDWALQDREDYSSDGGFIVDDEHISYSESEDSLDLANQGKNRKRRRSSDADAILSAKSAEKMINDAKKKGKRVPAAKESSGDESDSSEQSSEKGKPVANGKKAKKEDKDDLLTNFRELMFQRRHTPRRKRLRKLAKRLSLSPRKANNGSHVQLDQAKKALFPNGKKSTDSKANKKPSPISMSSSESEESYEYPSNGKRKVTQKEKPNVQEELVQANPKKETSASRPNLLERMSTQNNSKATKHAPSNVASSSNSKKPVIDLSMSPPPVRIPEKGKALVQGPPQHQKPKMINLLTPSPSPKPKPQHSFRREEPVKSPKKLIEIPKILSKSSAPSSDTPNTTNSKKRKREKDDQKKPVTKKSKKE